MQNKRILVTGAGGFIGSQLARELLRQGNFVRVVDIKWDGYIKEPYYSEKLTLDLREFQNCLKVTEGMDYVFNLAANMGGIGFITEVGADVMYDNVLINTYIMKACVENKVNRLFFSSSACIYPTYKQETPEVKPLKEEDAYPAEPDNFYGWEKLYTEKMLGAFKKDYNLDIRIARYHNIYGAEGTYKGGREKSPAALCRKIAEATDPGEIEIWGDGCFPESEQIISNPELKSIEDFKIDDVVLGTCGFQKVTNTFKRPYNGHLFTINPEGMIPFKVTAEHPILVFRLETFCRACGAHWCKPDCRMCYHSRCTHEKRFWKGWVKASDILEERDYLCVPKLKEEKPVSVDLRPYALEGHGDGRPQEQPSIPVIAINEDWAWVLGLYLAEGYSYDEKVSWCLGSHEKELREELHSRLTKVGLKWWEDNKKSSPWSRETHIANAPLSRWLREKFGSSAREKRIPPIFFSLPKSEMKEFIDGYFKGDGTSKSIYSSVRWTATSTSKNILVGIQVLLAKIGNFASIMWLENWGGKQRSCGTISYAEKPKNVHWFQDEDYIYIPIRDISKEDFEGNVYNIETEDHTYCLPAIVHNCQTRSYCYIDDCVRGTIMLMESDYKEPLNIGSDRLITIDELADIIIKISGKKIIKKYNLNAPQGVRGRNSDNTKLRRVLNWEPQINLEEGLEKTYRWIEEQVVCVT